MLTCDISIVALAFGQYNSGFEFSKIRLCSRVIVSSYLLTFREYLIFRSPLEEKMLLFWRESSFSTHVAGPGDGAVPPITHL